MKKILGSIALSVLLAGPAMAADMGARMPVKAAPAPVAVATYNWTGFYIGGHVGYGWSEFNSTAVTGSASFPVGFEFTPNEAKGILAGGQVGFNYQAGMIVLGVEAQGSWADLSGSARSESPVNTNYVITDRDVDWITTVAGRFGIAANNWLFYAKGGWAWAKTESYSETRNAAGTVVAITTGSTKPNGWMGGAGVEYGMTPNWSIKLEYNYIDFGTQTVANTSTSVPGGAVTTLLRDVDAHIHLVKGGINFRWGGAGPVVARY